MLQHDLEALIAPQHGTAYAACAMCVIHRGAVMEVAWGDVEGRPATPETLFDLASITKLFTATAFLSLVTEGRVSLSTPLVDVIPEFGRLAPRPMDGGQDPHSKAHQPTPPALVGQTVNTAAVTFRHLLTHTSGLPAWRDVYNAAGDAPSPPNQPDSIERETRWARAVEALVAYPFVAQPETRVIYSDIGLMLLGEAVSRLHGSPLDQVIRARVPDKMSRTMNHLLMYNPVRDHHLSLDKIAPTEDDPTWRKRRVWGEVHDENACGVGGVAGHAGLFGTANAVAAFGQAWLDGAGVFGINAMLATNATREHIEYEGARRGLGFALRAKVGASAGDLLSLNTFGHTGFTGTSLWIDPDAQLVIALLTNNVYFGRGGPDTITPFRRAVHDTIAKAFL